MVRMRMKCLFLLLIFIILYVVGSFICLYIYDYYIEFKISFGKDDFFVIIDFF